MKSIGTGYGNSMFTIVKDKKLYMKIHQRTIRCQTAYKEETVYNPSLNSTWGTYQNALKRVISIPFQDMPIFFENNKGDENYVNGLKLIWKAHTSARKYRKEVKVKMIELQEALAQVKASNKGIWNHRYFDPKNRKPFEDFISEVLPGGKKLIEKAEIRAVKIIQELEKKRENNAKKRANNIKLKLKEIDCV